MIYGFIHNKGFKEVKERNLQKFEVKIDICNMSTQHVVDSRFF